MSQLFRFASLRRFDRNEKYNIKKYEAKSPACFSGRNDISVARPRLRDEVRIGLWPRQSRHVAMRRSEGHESDHRENDVRSNDTLLRIAKCEM
jgi:hypothetical protein